MKLILKQSSSHYLKTCPHKNAHMMFIAALFRIPKTWKQPGCSSFDDLINWGASKQWNIIQWYNDISYQFMKKHGRTLMHIIKRKKPIWKDYIYYVIPSRQYSGKSRTMETLKVQ